MKRFQIFLPLGTIATLKQISDTKGVSVAEIVRRAVEDHLERIVPNVACNTDDRKSIWQVDSNE